MNGLFQGREAFNEDIGAWNTSTSSVTKMGDMFNKASLFNQNLTAWDTSRVTMMDGIFNYATSFNGDISTWTTQSLLSLDFAFSHASAFNTDISQWNTSSVWNATSFSHDLSDWSLDSAQDVIGMFYNASSFDHTLCWDLDLEDEFYASRVFCNSPGSFNNSCMTNPDLLKLVHEGCRQPKAINQEESLLATLDAKGSSDNSASLEEAIAEVINAGLFTPETSQKRLQLRLLWRKLQYFPIVLGSFTLLAPWVRM